MGKRKHRRARGTGSVFFSPRLGVWIGRGPGGKPEVQARTQAEVVARLAAAKPPGPDITVSAWADRWLDSLTNRPSTQTVYRKGVRHIRAHLGSVRLRDLTPTRVEAFAARLAGTLGPNTIQTTLAQLHNMLSGAVRDGILDRNPVSVARKPRGRRKKVDPFSPAELAAIIAGCDRPPLYPVALLAAVGCRIGEACGLDVGDFDPRTGLLTIRQTFDHAHGLRPPKTPNSLRTIRVPESCRPALVAATGGRTGGALFASGKRHRRRIPQQVSGPWKALLRRLGLAYRNPHQLRHSVATAMISAGVPPGDVAEFLGDTPETIVKTYLHPAGTDPSVTMDRLLSGGEVGGPGGKVGGPRKTRHSAG